jgi:hypothetical protein
MKKIIIYLSLSTFFINVSFNTYSQKNDSTILYCYIVQFGNQKPIIDSLLLRNDSTFEFISHYGDFGRLRDFSAGKYRTVGNSVVLNSELKYKQFILVKENYGCTDQIKYGGIENQKFTFLDDDRVFLIELDDNHVPYSDTLYFNGTNIMTQSNHKNISGFRLYFCSEFCTEYLIKNKRKKIFKIGFDRKTIENKTTTYFKDDHFIIENEDLIYTIKVGEYIVKKIFKKMKKL